MEQYRITITYMDSKVEHFVLKRDVAWQGNHYILVLTWTGIMNEQADKQIFIPMANVRKIESYKTTIEEPI